MICFVFLVCENKNSSLSQCDRITHPSRWMLVDLSSIRRLFVHLHYEQCLIFDLIVRLARLKSLNLILLDTNARYPIKMNGISSSLPPHVKHLTLKIPSLEEMKIVVNTSPHLSNISFNSPSQRKINSKEIIQWLHENRWTFTFVETDHSSSFWLK